MPRHRTLGFWNVDFRIANDGTTKIYYLTGITLEELEGSEAPPLPDGIRFTKTSPIKSIEGNVVTTCSGSRYHLGSPNSKAYSNLGLEVPELLPMLWTRNPLTQEELEKLFPPHYLNPWVNGDNWLTI